MRTLIIILGGFALWGACLGAIRLFGSWTAPAITAATGVFVALWLILAAVNLWIGVAQAGYSVREELPIFLLIFIVPAAVATLVRWKML